MADSVEAVASIAEVAPEPEQNDAEVAAEKALPASSTADQLFAVLPDLSASPEPPRQPVPEAEANPVPAAAELEAELEAETDPTASKETLARNPSRSVGAAAAAAAAGGGGAAALEEGEDSDPDLDDDIHFEDVYSHDSEDQNSASLGATTSVPGGFSGATLRETQEKLRRQAVRHHIEECDAQVTGCERQVAETEYKLQVAADRAAAKDKEVDDAIFSPLSTSSLHQTAARSADHSRYLSKLEFEAARLTKAADKLRDRLESERDELAQARLASVRFHSLGGELADADAADAREASIAGGSRVKAERSMARREVASKRKQIADRAAKEQAAVERDARVREAAVASLARAKPLMDQSFAKSLAAKREVAEYAEQEDRRKIDAVLSLKSNSDNAAEKDRRRAAARVKRQKKAKELEKVEHAAILKDGGNPEAVFLARQREAAAKAKREAVAEKARQNREAIVQTMIREETEYERKQQAARRQPKGLAAAKSTKRNQKKPQPQPPAPDTALKALAQGFASMATGKAATRGDGAATAAASAPPNAADGEKPKKARGVGLSAAEFERLDKNNDGSLDPAELMKHKERFLPGFDNNAFNAAALGTNQEEEDDEGGLQKESQREEEEEEEEEKKEEEDDDDDEDVFAQPEFAGLWSGASVDDGAPAAADFGPSPENEDTTFAEMSWKKMGAAKMAANAFGTPGVEDPNALPERVYTKLEQRILDDALVRQKAGIVKEQVVAGRTFKGTAFSARPERIVFSDFEVGKTYRQKIILTNISYSTNSFQLLPTPASFIDYEYKPSGGLSPGMTTEMTVVFTPRLNEDVDLAVALLAHTGPFSIPLICTTKKCKISYTPGFIDFGHLVVGETETMTLKVKNDGALDTRWTLTRSSTTAIEGIDEAESAATDEELDVPPPMTIFSLDDDPGSVSPESAAGVLNPHSATSVQFQFKPYSIGATETTFKLEFSNPDTPAVDLVVKGMCDASPVYLVEPTIDFNVCRVKCSYASPVVVKNRHAKHGTNVTFDIPKAARRFVTMSAYSGPVPPQSELRTEVHVNPTTEMVSACSQFLEDGSDDSIVLPITVLVEGQTLPCLLELKVKITDYGISVSESNINFGFVTVHESAIAKVTLCNKSCLPQRFGFVDVPSCLSVQPGDGFGELLPLETREVDMLFSPQPLPDDDGDRKYNFSIVCKWNGEGGQHTINCHGVGVVPPVRLSTASVRFAAVAAGDESWSSVSLTNTTDRARRFEFALPADCAVDITPRSGVIEPNGLQMIHLIHSPTVPAAAAKAAGAATNAAPATKVASSMSTAGSAEDEAGPTTVADAALDEEASAADAGSSAESMPATDSTPADSTDENSTASTGVKAGDDVADGSAATEETSSTAAVVGFAAAAGDVDAAAVRFEGTAPPGLVGRMDKLSLPCATQLANGLHAKVQTLSAFESRDVVFLELEMPVIPAKLGFVDDKASIVYTDIAVGSQSIKHVTVENFTNEEQVISASALSPSGPFRIVGALRPIPPQAKVDVKVCFEPESAGDFFAELELITEASRVRFRLAGMSVQPSLQIEETTLDLGDLLPGQVATKRLKMVNVSPFPVTVVTRLQSEVATRRELCPPELHSDAKLPAFSLSAVPALAVTPSECTIAPKGDAFVDVTFSPDRPSSQWLDYLYVKLTTEDNEQKVALVARSWAHPVFVLGGELPAPGIEEDPLCSIVPAIEQRENPVFAPPAPPVDPNAKPGKGDKGKTEKPDYVEKRELLFQFSLSSGETSASQSVTLSMLKANVAEKGGAKGDFAFEIVPSQGAAQSSMFIVENGKSAVDPGAPKSVDVKFQPPDLASVLSGLVYSGTASLVVKASGETQLYDFELHAFVTD